MTRQDVAALVVRMAVDNPRWGYTRIRGALSNLGHTIARTTVKRILHDHGVDPAPERSRHMPWNQLLQRPPPPRRPDADVRRRVRLGGLLSFYNREAA